MRVLKIALGGNIGQSPISGAAPLSFAVTVLPAGALCAPDASGAPDPPPPPHAASTAEKIQGAICPCLNLNGEYLI
jgi:hypothetical protein